MSLSQHVFLYCERGTNEALFAEPLNAASNASFLLAALAAFLLLLRRPREMRSADHYLFIALVFQPQLSEGNVVGCCDGCLYFVRRVFVDAVNRRVKNGEQQLGYASRLGVRAE